MNTPELLPIASGFLLGCVARYAWVQKHRWLYLLAMLVLAVCATVASGEFRQSWGFLLADIGFVSLSALAGFFVLGTVLARIKVRIR